MVSGAWARPGALRVGLALSLLTGLLSTLAVTLGAAPASATGSISCTGLNGTMTFGTPIYYNGTPTTSKRGNSTVLPDSTVRFNCGATGNGKHGYITIKGGKNARNANYSKKTCKSNPGDTDVCDKYVEGTQAEFSGLISKKTLKLISFRIDGTVAMFKTMHVTTEVPGQTQGDPCESAGNGLEVAVIIQGEVKRGIYATNDASVTLCLGGDSGPNTTDNFKTDLASTNSAVQIDTAQIDSTDSVATL